MQVLDPATGTGTFLAEVIKHIHQKFKNQAGIWPKYVENDLIPRLNGFELLMTSYAMAHLKMDILLTETGFTNPNNKRFKIFLTNSLEEPHDNQFNLFTQWLSQEANEANAIKKDAPVMCVIGNPPYSVSSTNKGPWIQNLIADYKKDLNERKINLDDDYIKFIRYGQHFIDKNGEGVLAYISANSFLDGLTHRQMRKHLLESFDKIYIIDLHGNSKKKEICPDGSPDQNVFDIMTGVSINIFIKTSKKKQKELGQVFHFDLFGKRDYKYSFLNQNSINIEWNELKICEPYYFFVPKNFDSKKDYESGFKIDGLMKNVSGIETKRDHFAIDLELSKLTNRISDFIENDYTPEERKRKFDLRDNEWIVEDAVKILRNDSSWKHSFVPCLTRPFDTRSIIYNGTILSRDRGLLMAGMNYDNYGLVLGRQSKEDFAALITNSVCTHKIVTVYDRSFIFPLYIYSENGNQESIDDVRRTPNLDYKIVKQIAKGINHSFVPDEDILVDLPPNSLGVFYPLDVMDYIYAVLHSPSYREKYKEFLKIDFPRVPYPTDADKFWKLVALGKELREIHLLESPKVEEYITGYPEDGDNIVGKPTYKNGSVYINETQYFSNVPEVAWNFYIGGYQPAQKWLKDRKDRELSYDDILHYQKIIVALSETDRIMKEIDEVGTL